MIRTLLKLRDFENSCLPPFTFKLISWNVYFKLMNPKFPTRLNNIKTYLSESYIKPDILFTTFIVGQKVTLLQKFCDDLHNHSKTKLFFAGNPDLLRLVNTHGKVFYSLDEFDRFFNNSSLN